MAKKFLAVLLAVLLTAGLFSACSQSTDDNGTETTAQTVTQFVTDDENFKLSYTQSDSLDPFKAKTQNNQVLASLVFESLFDLDETFSAVPNIATGYEYTESKILKVTIPSGLHFSDGSALTSEDVVYSFNAAADSPAYGSTLKGIDSAYADGDNIIVFSLKYANPYAHNLLSFPIASTDDSKDGYPIGSGKYQYKATDRGMTLIANDIEGFKPHITTIHLVNIAAADSIDNAVNIGNISYAFRDLSENSTKRITAAKKQVPLNNLVYIGFNNKSASMSNANIRKAVSLAIDRATIAKSAYSGYASAATGVFHPSFELASSTKIFSETADTAAAKQQVSLSSLEAKDLEITLLINDNVNRTAAASLIKSELEAVGFKVTVEKEKFSTYKTRIKNLDYDIYLGETRLPNDMCLNTFFTSSGAARYGIDQGKESTAAVYKKYLNGEEELGKFILSFSENMPYVPILYRKGMICYSKSLKGDMQGYYNNFFANIEDWYFE